MSAERYRAAPADLVILILTPALIMALISSLVFFLVEVFYAGAYTQRLLWMLFFFVVGAVLIARIARMGEIAGRANLYSAVLGGLVWIGLGMYVTYPPGSPAESLRALVNLGLVVLILWCARGLTKDCTDLGDDIELTGEGLLQAAGLEALDPRPHEAAGPDVEVTVEEPKTWIERYYRYRERKRRRPAPGVWVVYFSLAALPLFGLGQALIPPEAEERRRYTFVLMTVYVGSGLGLLLTTCFLGLRRYLRQRKLDMPKKMTAAWLGVGVVLIGLLLLAGAFLPRPNAEYSVVDLGRVGSEKRQASQQARSGDEAGEGESRQSGKDAEPKDVGEGKDAKGQARDGKSRDAKARDSAGKDRDKGSGKGDRDGKKAGEPDGKDEGQEQEQTTASTRTTMADTIKSVAVLLKWLVFGLLALLVLVLLLRGGLRWLANFSSWARDLLAALRRIWDSLFGAPQSASTSGEEGDTETERAEVAPFASFGNPFRDGRAAHMSGDELVRYTFAALQAWATEHGWPRAADETALEFAERLGEEMPALAVEVRRLATLYARCVYAPAGGISDTAVESLRGFWQKLEAAHDRPLSA